MTIRDGRIKRKYQAFISSTFHDLQQHRQKAILGIVKAGHMPVALENFSPKSESTTQVIDTALSECQYYVIILGARYGTIPDTQEKSFTEIEYDMAVRHKLRILAFVMDIKEVERIRKTPEWQEMKEEMANIERYEVLRSKLTGGSVFYRPFTAPDEIYNELYAYFSREHDATGYILEPQDRSDANILHIYARNEIVRDVVESLGQFMYVDPRLTTDTAKKQALARAFNILHRDHVKNKYEMVFFESGSTVTYVAKQLAGILPERGEVAGRKGSGPLVLTNNAFAYLYLWLCSGVVCHPIPEGPPDIRYGGMYGPLTDRQRDPDYNLPPLKDLDPEAAKSISELVEELFPQKQNRKMALLLAAASGLQLTDDVDAVHPDDGEPFTDERILEKLRKCRGFHVGSYENMLFKRCYYLSGIPAIVMIHDKKINSKIRVGRCHFLFDQGTPWPDFIASYPLSIWTACERASYQEVREKMEQHLTRDNGGWKFLTYAEASEFPILIGHNQEFRDACKALGVPLHMHSEHVVLPEK